ncbi:hypothetical protein L211DRAFT_725672 [Terfezia boudieri ATCC MYA-4762]|uniref:Uncharacterized protein n=1 Tax=Terfezia boudieri ATCC MYA-4762 TaxID=1051890 RepID=A0A3N4LAK1_9PEZI|nr:hypothetical protein L211DRAFT_725672 [Terfezia boudieri ATCC MYA-4762]
MSSDMLKHPRTSFERRAQYPRASSIPPSELNTPERAQYPRASKAPERAKPPSEQSPRASKAPERAKPPSELYNLRTSLTSSATSQKRGYFFFSAGLTFAEGEVISRDA